MKNLVWLLLLIMHDVSAQNNNIYRDALTCTYLISVIDNKGKLFTGTGVVVGSNGYTYVVTAKHLIKHFRNSGDTVTLMISGGSREVALTEPIYFSVLPDGPDVAVMQFGNAAIKLSQLNFPPTDSSYNIDIGDEIVYSGFPVHLLNDSPYIANTVLHSGGIYPLIRWGRISGMIQQNSDTRFIIDSQNTKGYSGGPVFLKRNNKLQLIGIMIETHLSEVAIYPPGKKDSLKMSLGYSSGTSTAVSFIHAEEIINFIRRSL